MHVWIELRQGRNKRSNAISGFRCEEEEEGSWVGDFCTAGGAAFRQKVMKTNKMLVS